MSRSLANRLRDERPDDGFGLIEIMISMTIFAIVVIATAPMLVGGLKAGRTSQLNLQGKGLAQERLELMRNLPFHVARQNGQYLDVLDIYFRDVQPTGTLAANDKCSARSYDTTTKAYTCRIDNLGADYPGFTQTIITTFLDFQRNPVTPPAGYDSQVSGQDTPVSALLGVAVTTSWIQGSKVGSYTLRSQIANAQADGSIIRASLRLAALSINSTTESGDILQFEGGLVTGEGSLTTGSTANLNVTTARAALASGTTELGASLSLIAPPAKSGASPSDSTGHLLDGTCDLICFGQTSVTGNQDVTVAMGQPQISSPASPVVAALRRTGSNTYQGFSYGNVPITNADPALRLAPGGRMVSAGLGSTTEVLNGSGYIDAAGAGASAVTSYGQATLPMLQLFPTDFAPDGVVQVVLDFATLSCTSGGGGGSVSSTWSAKVRYWQQTGVDVTTRKPTGAYVEHVVKPGGAALPDPKTTLVIVKNLNTQDVNADGVADGVEADDVPLSRWVQAWSGLSNSADVVTSSGVRSTGKVSAVVSVITEATRLLAGTPDKASALNVSVGTLSCHAEDNR